MTGSDAKVQDNPYVGPRAFGRNEGGRFFGRDKEARDLIPLVIAERLVLFYAQSGAGKSSLINTKLIPGLEERNFQVLPVARVSGQSEANAKVDNIFVYNLLLSLDRQNGHDPAQLSGMTLPDYLANLDVAVTPAGNGSPQPDQAGVSTTTFLDAPQVINGVHPMALLVDQFEEIFTTHPEAWQQREPFFQQLCNAMEADPYLWVILVMREDYIAGLDPYVYLLPGRLRARYSMKRMEYDSALEAVTKPAELDGRPFEPGVAEELVDNLRRVVAGRDANGQPIFEDGEFIEPVQLQVVCYQLWEQLKGTPGASITHADLDLLTRGKPMTEFISRALADFYNQAVEYVIHNQPGVNERAVREMFSEKLITEAGTRGLVFRGEDTTEGLPNEVFHLLESQHIIRTENRGGSTWYELVHDRFVDPILQANREWNERYPRKFQRDAEEWIKSGRDHSCLYEGKQLLDAVAIKDAHRDELSPEELEFIQAGETAAEATRSKRQRQLMGVIVGVAAVLIALTVFSLVGWNSANLNKSAAETQRSAALAAASTSDAYSQLALQREAIALTAQAEEALQRHAAETAQALEASLKAEADVQRNKAVTAEAQALVDRNAAQTSEARAQADRAAALVANNQSQAGRLAILADYFQDKKPDLSLLLAVEGVNLADNWSTRQSMLNSLQQGLNLQLSQDGGGLYSDDRVSALAYNPTGDRVAVGYTSGSVRVVSSDKHLSALTIPEKFKSQKPVNNLSFSYQNDYLASAGFDGIVRIMNLSTSEVTLYSPFDGQPSIPMVRSVAFQPTGPLLAVATDAIQLPNETSKFGHVILYDYLRKQVVKDFEIHASDNCTVLAWSQEGNKLAVGTQKGFLSGIDPIQKAALFPLFKAHDGAVMGLAWYPEPATVRLASGGVDQQLIQWDTSTQKALLKSNTKDTPPITGLDISTNGRFIITSSSSDTGRVAVWDAETLTRKQYPFLESAHTSFVYSIKFSPRGSQFISGSYDGNVLFWKFTPVDSLEKPVTGLSMPKDKGRLDGIYPDSQGNLLAAQLKGTRQLQLWTRNNPTPRNLVVDYAQLKFGTYQSQPVLVTGDWNGKVNLVDAQGKILQSVSIGNGTISSLALSGDGKLLASTYCLGPVGTNCDNFVLWDLVKNQKVDLTGKLDRGKLGASPTSMAFNPDNSLLAVGTSNSRVLLYHLKDGSISQVVTEGLNISNSNLPITSIAFSPAEVGLLAAGFYDGRIALWTTSNWYPVGEYADRMSSEVTGMFFQQDKDEKTQKQYWVLTASSSVGEVWNWQVDLNQWNARACMLANRLLTADEKVKFLPADRQGDDPCKDMLKK